MADLRVLMLGGRRCGKTSALASMFHSIKNGQTSHFLTLADDTIPQVKGLETQDSLTTKTAELEHLLNPKKINNATFLVDQNPSNEYWDYRLKVQIPGKNKEMYINFRDVPGEFCRQGNPHFADMQNFVSECDVFIIAIDTPYLMESVNPKNSLCTEGINDLVNRIPDIQDYLTNINDNNGQDGKMVIFTPVKCEKWFNEGRISEVTKRVQDVYSTCITALKAYQKMDISIIPILTAGNIEFVEQREAFILIRPGKNKRCCMVSNKMIRFEDGTPYKIKESDNILEDPVSVIKGSNLMRPYSWFNIRRTNVGNANLFAPVNCEQLPLHIIRFMLQKYDYNEAHPTTFWGIIKDIFQSWFGNMDLAALRNALVKLQTSGVIKDSEDDGIVHIKTAY